jgi:hypothetical protein
VVRRSLAELMAMLRVSKDYKYGSKEHATLAETGKFYPEMATSDLTCRTSAILVGSISVRRFGLLLAML